MLEADIDALIKDFEVIEHGEIDVDTGLEIIVQDFIKILHDFGVSSPENLDVETTSESRYVEVAIFPKNPSLLRKRLRKRQTTLEATHAFSIAFVTTRKVNTTSFLVHIT